jgi:hypothetical protein
VARGVALAAAVAVSLLVVSGAGGAATQQTPKRGGTLVVRVIGPEPACLNLLDARCNPLQPGTRNIVENVLERAFEVDSDFEYRAGSSRASTSRGSGPSR